MSSAATGGGSGAGKGDAPLEVLNMATKDTSCDFKPMRMQRRAPTPYDIVIDMKYCGICHSDLHSAAGHLSALGQDNYPLTPGHELAGVVSFVGSNVTKFRVGDKAGVGCLVDSCKECAACRRGDEHKCRKSTATYAAKDNGSGRAAIYPPGGITQGGYTSRMVVHQDYGIKIAADYPLEMAGPIMCAAITMYSPLQEYGAGPGSRVGVVGLGGLGQMGVRLGKALGCHVTAITRSAGKTAFAKEKCGADAVLVSTDAAAMAAAAHSFDLILNTIPVHHDFYAYSALLDTKRAAKQVLLGLHPGLAAALVVDGIVCGGSKIKASIIGSIAQTQAVMDLVAKHKIYPEIKIIPVEGINEVYSKLDANNDTGERYVIDIAGSLNEDAFKRCADVPPPTIRPAKESGAGLTIGGILGQICYMLCCCRYRR